MITNQTLVDLIVSRKDEETKGITFILSNSEERFISYGELYNNALSLLYNLQTSGFKEGDEVIFQIDDNQSFIFSFWACILGRMIPVPVTTGTNDEHKLKLFKIWEILKSPKMIAAKDFLLRLQSFAQKNGLSEKMDVVRERTLCLEEIDQRVSYGEIHRGRAEDIAFIQFSSGSTGDPKGVIITHKNVLTNLNAVIRWAGITPEDIGLNWMPLTHDMGLIGTHIKGMLALISQYNIHTQLFIRNPSLWIKKASERKVTILYSPNFGYKHFLKFFKEDEKRELDLSSVRLIYNGAEPISLDLCNEFLDKMAKYGLKRNAMYPVYGLAEGTIAVTFPHPQDELTSFTLRRDHLNMGDTVEDTDKEGQKGCTFVDVGYPIYDCSVCICDEEDRDLGENKIGYVKIRGGNVTSGYYNNEKSTKRAITKDGWLNTGDLGFLRNGRLVITGRAKDVIFISGQNYYSHDIERVVEEIDGVELGKAAALGVFNERLKSDELILFIIFKGKIDRFIPMVSAIRSTISEKIGIEVSHVIPVKSIPKTTSGKVQRYKFRENYINGNYDDVKNEIQGILSMDFESREIDLPQNELEEKMVSIWSQVLNTKNIGSKDNFFELGGDSLKTTQLISRIREEFGKEIDPEDLFKNPELAKLADIVDKAQNYAEEFVTKTCEEVNLPLSFSQKRLWFLDRLNGNSAQYNLYSILRLQGEVNYDVLVKSFNEILRRHEILRASFKEEDGQPKQIINNDVTIDIPLIDIREGKENERTARALMMAEEEVRRPFNLEKPSLFKGMLFKIAEHDYILLLKAHHIIFDGWSFSVLIKELASCYEAYIAGGEHKLPVLKIQYPDFARWQIERQNENSFKDQLGYWKQKLTGRLPVLDFPIDKQRPAVQTYNGAKYTSFIPHETVEKLKSAAKKEGATLYMILLAVFKALLYKYTGQEDIIIGSPVANRNRLEIEPLIGFFTNNLILRTTFSKEDSFCELLRNVRDVSLEVYKNQDVPFEKIVETLNVERDMSRNPIFQVLFSMQNTPLEEALFSDIRISRADIDGGYSRFDIAVDICETAAGLEVNFEYNTDLFYKDTIKRLGGHYSQLLNKVVGNLELQISRIDILTDEERKTLLEDWNDTRVDFGDVSCWTEVFEGRTEETPDSEAVVSGDLKLTYRQLNQRANQLANYLISMGVGQETIVGVYMDRSADMIVALLGVHKAGGAYLPMDPIFPRERLEYMIKNAEASFILTDKESANTLPFHNTRVICLDTLWSEISQQSIKNPGVRCAPNNLAYVIYTSGSTGKPKGVQIEHRALTNFLLSMAQDTQVSSDDSLLAVTTLSFDIAGLELFLPLITGAKVVIANRNQTADGERLIDLLDKYRITFMQATPATWRLLVEAGWKGSRSLKILCGGEALPQDLAGKLLKRCSCLWNVYGPTETTIWSTMTKIESSDRPVHIGKPIANTSVYILDRAMNHTPVGVAGELYIGGDGLARGYLGLPELTEEKFISSPFSAQKGEKIYKTGDMARFMPDGNIEYIGRVDNQVKVRGFRIELGEIEAILSQKAEIRESVVVARELYSGEIALVAYIIPELREKHESITAGNLREYLKARLPFYMVPSFFVNIDSFPMTPNGKIDRKSLPAPKDMSFKRSSDYLEASSHIQKIITKIWKDVLVQDRIGINDNFFDLGGHSLLLAKVRSKIEKTLNVHISMMDLFKYPTISSLADFLEDKDNKTKKTEPRDEIQKRDSKSNDIAIIGLSARIPGAKNIDEFWKNLCGGVESITTLSDQDIIEEGIDPEILKKSNYVKAWGVLDDVDKFDAKFFGYNPREAKILDPQQRIFLEEAWKALENSGYDPQRLNGLVGTFASVGMNTYIRNLDSESGPMNMANNYQIMINNDKDFLATRVSYKLNLEGPAVTVQTACSSSLVAVHLACQSLINGECDMALAGGVSVRLPQKTGYLYQEGMILSEDGHCRAFDHRAGGTVGGNGAGVVVLKRLVDAVADGDFISAVIKGSAINNDGSMKIGYTAPRVEGQARVIEEAHRKAGVNPEDISYIEAHGTGTPLGDPIEIEALKQVFCQKTDKKLFCAIGSVKTNIGHLDAAAGVTGLIKTVLALRNKALPPSLNFTEPNPKIDFDNSPFYVNTKLKKWSKVPLRAGVSSFGIGGTNAHVVLEEAPLLEYSSKNNSKHLMVFSAKTREVLDSMTSNFLSFLKANENIDIGNAAFTLQVGRREFEYRRFFICSSREDAIKVLENKDVMPQRVFDSGYTLLNTTETFDEKGLKEYSLEKLGYFWLEGAKIDWYKLYEGEKRQRIPLPVYPFEPQLYWAEASFKKNDHIVEDKTAKKNGIEEWFYAPVWKQSAQNIPTEPELAEGKNLVCLVLMRDNTFENMYADGLERSGFDVVRAVWGNGYHKKGIKDYTFNPLHREDYNLLLKDISNMEKMPSRIINMLGITRDQESVSSQGRVSHGKMLFYSMLYITQAIGRLGWNKEVKIKAMTNNMQRIMGEPVYSYEKSLILGPCKVIPREYPNIKCTSIDFILPEDNNLMEQELLDQLLFETCVDASDAVVAYRGRGRFIQFFEKLRLNDENKSSLKIRNDGVYLITGGLGGIGLALAEQLAKKAPVKLVLVGRSQFPDMSNWDQWLLDHDKNDKTSLKIKQLKHITELGSKVLICQADINDINEIQRVSNLSRQQFGEINGVIHAAGNPGGGMIQLKKDEFAENVLAPKVTGTVALYDALKDLNPDFFIFCSSLNAITGGFGQVDYSAANAFMDAFALSNDSRRGTRLISINWDRWPGVGMAVDIGKGSDFNTKEVHPLLGNKIINTVDKTVYLAQFDPKKDWVLSEHLVMGIPTIAGTTYLEMARAAFSDINGEKPLEIVDVTFLTPMAVKENEKQDVLTILERNGSSYDFKVVSRLYAENTEENLWQEHVRGRIVEAKDSQKMEYSLRELMESCSRKLINPLNEYENISEEFISFGERWRSLKKLNLGSSEGIVEVELNPEFIKDLKEYKLHPALFDVATGSVRLADGGNYLPFSYEKITVKETLCEKIYGYIRFKDDYNTSSETITCDIDLINDKGIQLIEIKNFTMRLISEVNAANLRARSSSAHPRPEYTECYKAFWNTATKVSSILDEGITPLEGRKAFKKVLAGCLNPQVIISTKDIEEAILEAGYVNRIKDDIVADESDVNKALHPRPELESEYVAPKSENEKRIAKVWERLLGIEGVGIYDEFFELGGDSLLLVQLHSKIKEMFKSEIAVVDLYKYNTISLLVKYLEGENKEAEKPNFENVNQRVNKQLTIMKQRRKQMQRIYKV